MCVHVWWACLIHHNFVLNRSTSATDIYCVKAKHGSGYIKNHLSSVELDHFSPPTIMDPHVRSLVFEACQSSALGTEL